MNLPPKYLALSLNEAYVTALENQLQALKNVPFYEDNVINYAYEINLMLDEMPHDEPGQQNAT